MTSVSIIGTGTMGTTIADLLARGGAEVQRLGHDDGASAVSGDVVVLAVPYPAIGDVIAQRGAELAGKVVVDISNPLDFSTFDSLVVPADTSAAAQIAAALPAARVLKAFNTTFGATLASGTVGDAPTTVLIAGDDDDAKAVLASLVRDAGLAAVDAGALKRARELEALGFLQLTLAAGEKISWTGGFALQH